MTTPALPRFTAIAAEARPAAMGDGRRPPLPALRFRPIPTEANETPTGTDPKPPLPALHFLAGPHDNEEADSDS
ncbi:hypothetical protein [Actinoplanes xinjiangensis]|uniref:hypothetical protein n=1 Tax=Actinoplanes xinjiangensis TaxID=512350 RepID=UPI00342D4AC2